MYAIIRNGGHQYRVTEGETVEFQRLGAAAGEKVEFKDILMVRDDKKTSVGAPVLEGAKVVGTVLAEMKDRKVIIFKKKRRKTYRRKRGHRQIMTSVIIDKIQPGA